MAKKRIYMVNETEDGGLWMSGPIPKRVLEFLKKQGYRVASREEYHRAVRRGLAKDAMRAAQEVRKER